MKDIPWAWGAAVTSIPIAKMAGNIKIKVTKSWGTAKGLSNYLKNNRKIKQLRFTTKDSFTKAVKAGTIKLGAVVIGFDNTPVWHAGIIGKISNGNAYYFAHSENRNAMSNGSNVFNFFDDGYTGIYVYNIL